MLKKLFVMLIFASLSLTAQVISTIPTFPTENDTITIIFNAEQAERSDLVGYTGDVYAHTGITTNIGEWQHVIGGDNWGNNSVEPKLTRIGTDLYQLVIPGIRNYYSNVSGGETVQGINLVFRSSSASLQTEDLYVPIYQNSYNVAITLPSNLPVFKKIGEDFDFQAVSSNSDSLKLYIDDNVVETILTDTLDYNISVTDAGKHTLKVMAYFPDDLSASDSSYYLAINDNTIADLPEGVIQGINYTDNSTVTLALYAPKKQFVHVIGDFNNWQFSSSYQMNLTADSTIYWLTVNGLTPGQEYAFQYVIDGSIRIADPYTDKVLDPWNDQYIDNATYPNLKPYPVGKTTELVSVLQTGQSEFNWGAADYKRPDKKDLVIYELLVRDFTEAHDYKAIVDTIGYLEKLGVNAIELMPVNEFEGNLSWGYNPSLYFAPDKYYGPKNDLKKLIDECHKRGIAVILDMVLNHSYGQSPMVRMYFENGKPSPDNPYYNVNSNFTNPDAQWGYDFNHESPATQYFVDRLNKYWMTEYKVDGFRFDFTKGFGNNIKTSSDPWGSVYDADRIRLLERMSGKIWETDSTAFVIFEHLAENREEEELSDYGIMLWGNMNHAYTEASMGYTTNYNSDLSDISYKNRGWSEPNLVGYMESHDEERMMYKNITYGNAAGSYNIKEKPTAIARTMLASTFFYTVPGPKMLWMFGELGYDYSIEYGGRVSEKPIRWDYLQDSTRADLYKVISVLINLKKKYNIFQTGNFSPYIAGSVKAIYLNSDTMNVAVIGNFDVTAKSLVPKFQHFGTWYDYFYGDSIDVPDANYSKSLAPGEFHIYTDVKLETPEQGILTDVKDKTSLPLEFSLSQNYPNPFNPTTTIKYTVPQSPLLGGVSAGRGGLMVSLKVYNILGQQVAELVNKEQSAGSYLVKFDASSLASGVYIYRLTAGDYVNVKKMMLLK